MTLEEYVKSFTDLNSLEIDAPERTDITARIQTEIGLLISNDEAHKNEINDLKDKLSKSREQSLSLFSQISQQRMGGKLEDDEEQEPQIGSLENFGENFKELMEKKKGRRN